jgi:hypothetical protein
LKPCLHFPSFFSSLLFIPHHLHLVFSLLRERNNLSQGCRRSNAKMIGTSLPPMLTCNIIEHLFSYMCCFLFNYFAYLFTIITEFLLNGHLSDGENRYFITLGQHWAELRS